MRVTKGNVEYLQGNLTLTETALKPLINCWSHWKWNLGTQENCCNQQNTLYGTKSQNNFWCWQSTNTKMHMWDAVIPMYIWQRLASKNLSCCNSRPYKYLTYLRWIVYILPSKYNMLLAGNRANGNTHWRFSIICQYSSLPLNSL